MLLFLTSSSLVPLSFSPFSSWSKAFVDDTHTRTDGKIGSKLFTPLGTHVRVGLAMGETDDCLPVWMGGVNIYWTTPAHRTETTRVYLHSIHFETEILFSLSVSVRKANRNDELKAQQWLPCMRRVVVIIRLLWSLLSHWFSAKTKQLGKDSSRRRHISERSPVVSLCRDLILWRFSMRTMRTHTHMNAELVNVSIPALFIEAQRFAQNPLTAL